MPAFGDYKHTGWPAPCRVATDTSGSAGVIVLAPSTTGEKLVLLGVSASGGTTLKAGTTSGGNPVLVVGAAGGFSFAGGIELPVNTALYNDSTSAITIWYYVEKA